ncbi:MAG TPA: phosphotransferase [Candidatus Binatia bacterium]|nr:phosphotransferase [Candidatus Binatia bacterium]
MRPPLTCVLHWKGINDTYKVTSPESTFYLRVYVHGWRTKEEVNAEVDLLKALASHGLPVSKPVRCLDGSYVQELAAPEGARFAVLFTGATGIQCLHASKRQSFTYGALAAKIHNCTDRLPRDYKRFHIDTQHLVDEPLKNLRPFLDHRRKDFDFLQNTGEAAKVEAMKLPRTAPEYGICHGDLHYWNVLFEDSGKLMLFDFDCFGYGWRAYDVSVFLWSQYWLETNSNKRKRPWDAFLRGYRSERVLSQKELDAVPVFGAMRQIWLMGLHADISNGFGAGRLNDAYLDRSMKFVKDWVKEYGIFK